MSKVNNLSMRKILSISYCMQESINFLEFGNAGNITLKMVHLKSKGMKAIRSDKSTAPSLPVASIDAISFQDHSKKLIAAGILRDLRNSHRKLARNFDLGKANGSMRICGDYCLTVNQAAQKESYPLPRIEDLLSNLAGGDTFTKLDLSNAYQQVALDEESRKYVVINTHLGLFQYNRLPFG